MPRTRGAARAAAISAVEAVRENEDLLSLITRHVLRTHDLATFSAFRAACPAFLRAFQQAFRLERQVWWQVWLPNIEYELTIYRAVDECKGERVTRRFPAVEWEKAEGCPNEWASIVEPIHKLRSRADELVEAIMIRREQALKPPPAWHPFKLSDFRLHVALTTTPENVILFCGSSQLGTPTAHALGSEFGCWYGFDVANFLGIQSLDKVSLYDEEDIADAGLNVLFTERLEDGGSELCLTAYLSRSDGAVTCLGRDLDWSMPQTQDPSTLEFVLDSELPGLYSEDEVDDDLPDICFEMCLEEVRGIGPAHPLWDESTMREEYNVTLASADDWKTPLCGGPPDRESRVSAIDLVSITLTCPDPEIDDTIPDHDDWTDPRLQRQRVVEVERGTLERFMRLQWAFPSEHDIFGPLSDACHRTM